MTASALAAELEVTARTIYRDLEALSAAGIPVYAESGPGGGCQLVEGYRTPLTGLSVDEAGALLILGVPGPLRDLGLEPPLQAAQRRVRAATRLPNVGVTVHLDMPRWFHAREDTSHLPVLAKSIGNRRRVRVTYAGGSGTEKRQRLGPLGIVNKAGAWYLVAELSGRVRVFRVARIGSVRVLEETFERPSDFDLVTFWEAWSADFETSRPRIDVVVRASPEAFDAMPEVFGEAVRPALSGASDPDADGWRQLVLTFEHEAAAVQRLAGFGGRIEIQSPETVRARLVETAAAILDRYQ